MPVELSIIDVATGFAEIVVAIFINDFPSHTFDEQVRGALMMPLDFFCFCYNAFDAYNAPINFVNGQTNLGCMAIVPCIIIQKRHFM